MKKKYKFRDGTLNKTGVSAKTVYTELEKVRKKNKLTPKAVVEEARPVDAPLHPVFEWKDSIAGEKWREYQARNLIRSVVIIEQDAEPTPAFIHISKPSDAQYYEASEIVVQEPDLFATALQELHHYINGTLKTVKQLEQLASDADDGDLMMRISLAIRAVESAHAAITTIH